MAQYSMVQLLSPQAMESSSRHRLRFTHTVCLTVCIVAHSVCGVYCCVYWLVYPRRPRDFLRTERSSKGKGTFPGLRGKSGSRRGCMYNQCIPTAILSSLIHPQGCNRKYTPGYKAISIGSVKIKTSLVIRRECSV